MILNLLYVEYSFLSMFSEKTLVVKYCNLRFKIKSADNFAGKVIIAFYQFIISEKVFFLHHSVKEKIFQFFYSMEFHFLRYHYFVYIEQADEF